MKGERRKGRWRVGEGGIRAGPCRLTFFSGSLLLLSPARILYLKASTRIYDSRPSHSTPHTYLLLVPFFFLSHRPYTRSSNRFFARPFTFPFDLTFLPPPFAPPPLRPNPELALAKMVSSDLHSRLDTLLLWDSSGRGQRAWEGREKGNRWRRGRNRRLGRIKPAS